MIRDFRSLSAFCSRWASDGTTSARPLVGVFFSTVTVSPGPRSVNARDAAATPLNTSNTGLYCMVDGLSWARARGRRIVSGRPPCATPQRPVTASSSSGLRRRSKALLTAFRWGATKLTQGGLRCTRGASRPRNFPRTTRSSLRVSSQRLPSVSEALQWPSRPVWPKNSLWPRNRTTSSTRPRPTCTSRGIWTSGLTTARGPRGSASCRRTIASSG